MPATFVGIDVGAARKGFHLAAVAERRLVGGPVNAKTVEEAVDLTRRWRPAVVALDSPKTCAEPGLKVRADEREFSAARICAIRWTPDRTALHANPAYYGWILHGLELYVALEPTPTIEAFPTAAWTRWHGPRGDRPRARWSSEALGGLDLEGLPKRMSQDDRDAIAAACTASLHARGRAQSFGEIVVPAQGERP